VTTIRVSAYLDAPEAEPKTDLLGSCKLNLDGYAGTRNQAVADCIATLLGHFGDRMKSFNVSEV